MTLHHAIISALQELLARECKPLVFEIGQDNYGSLIVVCDHESRSIMRVLDGYVALLGHKVDLADPDMENLLVRKVKALFDLD